MLKSPFTPRAAKDFRILILYPNLQMVALMPQVVGIFNALLKREGYTIDVFDCTYYENFEHNELLGYENQQDEIGERVKIRMAASYDRSDWFKKVGKKPKTNLKEDFIKKVQDFKPDIILVSALESTYHLSINLLNGVPKKDKTYKTIFGGVFPTYAAQKIIKDENVDYICRGEGEVALIEMCKRLCTGGRIDNVQNFTVKGEGKFFNNKIGIAMNMDDLPIPDWDLLDPGSIYRPMQGKIWRAVGVETQRGCPYTCTFCNSPSNNVIYKEEANKIFHRKKSIKRLKKELDFLVNKYDPELIYFVVDTFLAMSNKEFDEFKEMYSDYKIPFWMNTRAETVTEYRANALEDINMLRCDVGVEHGNYEYRKNYLKRNITDEVQIRGFEYLADHKYTCASTTIIGMPDENRDLIFDTINLLRKLPKGVDANGASIYAPYHGTPLRELAIKKGYITGNELVPSIYSKSILKMPTITSEEISGIHKTFTYYVKFPKSRWDEIKIAEKDNPDGWAMHEKLGKEFDSKYRPKDGTPIEGMHT